MQVKPLSLEEKASLASGAIAYSDYVLEKMDLIGIKHKCCLLYSFLSTMFFRDMGIPCMVEAGSASWKMLTLEQQGDLLLENKPYHERFGYVFNEKGDYMQYILAGELPEMHSWVSLPNFEIFDPTVGYQHRQLLDLVGPCNEGVDNPLPDWLWDTPKSIYSKYEHFYDGDRVASVLATNLAHKGIIEMLGCVPSKK